MSNMNIEKIQYLIKSRVVPNIFYYPETDSTNTRAREYAKENPENKTAAVFIADSQTAGRGRLGKSFYSAQGTGIYISFLLYPNRQGADITKFTPFCAVKLSECVEELADLYPSIKWVNDIYTGGKKLAGILVEGEMDSEGNVAYLVCGMGINVYKTAFPREISDIAISIEEATRKKISREKFIARLIEKILSGADDFGTDEIFSSYKNRLDTVGKSVTVIKPASSYNATVKALNPDYSLTLTLPDGREEILFTGEVSIRKTNS